MKLFFAALFLSLAAYAQRAEQLLTRDLMAAQKSITRASNLYSYFQLPQMRDEYNTESGRQSFVYNMMQWRASQFWDENFTNDVPTSYASGAGMYFAIDPFVSSNYGNSYVELILPVGLKYINVVRPITIGRDTATALLAEGFTTRESIVAMSLARGFSRDTLRTMVHPEHRPFRQLVQKIFTAQQIQFIEYNYDTRVRGLCRRHSHSAFVFIGLQTPGDPLHPVVENRFRRVSFYSDGFEFRNLSPYETRTQARIERFREFLNQMTIHQAHRRIVTDEFLLEHYTRDEQTQLRSTIYSCKP